MFKRLACWNLALITMACATGPANPGPYPTNYAELVNRWMQTTVYDPYSVRDLHIAEPLQGTYSAGLAFGGRIPAWAVCVTYNAKNLYGGYVGLQTTVLWLSGGHRQRA
jgi:hypothetical protein